MSRIVPIPSNRTNESLIQQRLLQQLQLDERAMLNAQNQISSGLRLLTPSDDASASVRAIQLQRLVERKGHTADNLSNSRTFLTATESAISNVTDLLNSVRGTAVSVVGVTASDFERQVAAEEIRQTINSLLTLSNQKFRSRFLFAGSTAETTPFTENAGFIEYHGNDNELLTYGDIELLFPSNFSGHAVLGTISGQTQGANDLNPNLTATTRLRDLRGGLGVDRGRIVVSDSNNISTVDLRSAETVGDVIRLIETNPPTGRTISVRIENGALHVDLDDAGGGSLSIRDESGTTTAFDLGILNISGTGSGVLIGHLI